MTWMVSCSCSRDALKLVFIILIKTIKSLQNHDSKLKISNKLKSSNISREEGVEKMGKQWQAMPIHYYVFSWSANADLPLQLMLESSGS